jgi:hypothetical protein
MNAISAELNALKTTLKMHGKILGPTALASIARRMQDLKKMANTQRTKAISNLPSLQTITNVYPDFAMDVKKANPLLQNDPELNAKISEAVEELLRTRPGSPASDPGSPKTPGKGGKRKSHKRRRPTKKRKHTRKH